MDSQSAPEMINHLITGYWSTQAVYVAAKLGIADLLVDGPRTADDLAQIERAVPLGAAKGERYNAGGMATLDSERASRPG